MTILLENESIELSIIKKCLYINIKDLYKINENNINNTILYYKHIHRILNDNNLSIYMIIDFSNSSLSINSLSYTKIFVDLLLLIHPISETTVLGTFIIINNKITKLLIDMILNIYKNAKPIYIINNENDILNLIE
jgi:hypothetical protein